MNIFLPDLQTLCLAENAGGTLHNLLPLRGAEVRDAKAWAEYLTESLRLYGSRTEYLVTQHYWPRWAMTASWTMFPRNVTRTNTFTTRPSG